MLKEIYKLGQLTLFKKYKEQEQKNHNLIDLFWECTLTCNANCKHCGSSAEKRKYDGELTTEEIKLAFKQIAIDMDASKILINVTGGEPLMRKDLCEVMEYATGLGYRWGITTNGILLNGNICKHVGNYVVYSSNIMLPIVSLLGGIIYIKKSKDSKGIKTTVITIGVILLILILLLIINWDAIIDLIMSSRI